MMSTVIVRNGEILDDSVAQENLFETYESLQSQLCICDLREKQLAIEIKALGEALQHAEEEVKRIRSVPLFVGQFKEMVDSRYAIVSVGGLTDSYVRVLTTLDREQLTPSRSVALHRQSYALVDVLPNDSDTTIRVLKPEKRPEVAYSDIGGYDTQKQELREAVELPLKQAELYERVGIDPPTGVLLYGEPGTGKTMMAKAVAHHTNASFIHVVGSEFVQKYLGDGPKMVRDVFRLARENVPCIVFIDEIDAVGSKRFDTESGSDREIQRVLLELLSQMDGFDKSSGVKVIMATNRADTLDPALMRPGRLDRKIIFPLPDRRQKRLVFQVITSKMNIADDVVMEKYVSKPEKISCADIAAICQEAGMIAVRHSRYVVAISDFDAAYKKVTEKEQTKHHFYQ